MHPVEALGFCCSKKRAVLKKTVCFLNTATEGDIG